MVVVVDVDAVVDEVEVVAAIVVEVVVLVVVVAFTISVPKDEIAGTKNALLVL